MRAPLTATPTVKHRPPSPTGWSWLCPCGWSTGRNTSLEQTELRRDGHIRLHTAAIHLQKQAGIS